MSSPNTDLSKLGTVNPGDDIRGVARADRIMGLQNITKSQVNGEPYSQSSTINRVIGPGYVIHRNKKGRAPASGLATDYPWKISTIRDSFGFLYVVIKPGTINGALPINIFTPLAAPDTGTVYVDLAVVTDGKQITGSALRIDTSPPQALPSNPQVAPESFVLVIGVLVNASPFNVVRKDLMAETIITVVTTDNDGTGTQINNYSWKLSSY